MRLRATSKKACLGLATILALASSACSWAFMTPPPPAAPPDFKPDCGANGLERTDGMFSGIFLGLSAMGFGSYLLAREQEDPLLPPEVNLVTGSAYAVPALIFAAAAISGAIWAGRCNEQAERYLGWVQDQGQQVAGPLPPGAVAADPALAADPGPAEREQFLSDGRPCPQGAQVFGDPPPLGRENGCRRETGAQQPILHGPHASWYDTGSPATRGEYADGRPHGPWTYWYESGIKKLQASYDHGRQTGHWIYWDKRGEIFREVDFPAADDAGGGPSDAP